MTSVLRQLGLALAVLVLAVVPFQPVVRLHALVVRTVGGALAEAVGPSQEMLWSSGEWHLIERREAIRRFARDSERTSTAYAVLAVWAWVVVAPCSGRRRVRYALASVAVLLPLQILVACSEAVAAYRNSVPGLGIVVSDGYRHATVVLGSLTMSLAAVASRLMPIGLALLAHPGLPATQSSGNAS